MSVRSKRVSAVALLALSSTILAACSGGASTAAKPQTVEGGAATFAVDSVFLGFDPNVTSNAQDARVLRQVFDSLLYLKDGKVEPWLATNWEVSEDGLRYTFGLKKGVTFQDGTPFNADAVCYNLDRIKNPATASIYAIGLIGPYTSCKAVDATTAEITLSAPYAPFLNNLTSPFMGFNSPTAAKAKPPADYSLAPVGTGPFKITSYTPGNRVVLTRNEAYSWGPDNDARKGTACLKDLTFRIIPDPTVRIGSVLNGTIEAGSDVPPNRVKEIEGNSAVKVLSQPQSGAAYQLHLNSSRSPFNDPAVRAAASAALNVDAALAALYKGLLKRADSPLSSSTVGYSASKMEPFNAAAAAAALEKAGWTKGSDGVRSKGGERLRVLYLEGAPNRENRQDLAAFFKANLEAVGFDVELVFEQMGPLIARIKADNYDIAGLSLGAVDPNILYQMFDPSFIPTSAKFGFNWSHTNDPALTALLSDGQKAKNTGARDKIYADVQASVVKDTRTIPVYVPSYTLAVNGLQGIRFDAEGYPILHDTCLTK